MANKKENRGEQEMAAGLLYSPKFGYDLLQNCDLPPPMKVYAGQENAVVSPRNVARSHDMFDEQNDEGFGVDMADKKNSSEDGKLELLKALRLSQTRAREAERKVALLSKEKNDLANFLFRQSMELFAYKQWVKMMELRVSKQSKIEEKPEVDNGDSNWAECNDSLGMTCLVAVAICVGIAGVGLLSFFTSNYH